MTVFDLIRELSKLPSTATVFGWHDGHRAPIELIDYIESDNIVDLNLEHGP